MLRLSQSAILLALLVPIAGSRTSPRANNIEPNAEYYRLYTQVTQHLQRQEYAQAEKLAEQCHKMAVRNDWRRAANRALATLAGIDVWSFRYQQAIRRFLEARSQAEQIGDWEMVVMLSFNLSNVYFHLGALDEAQDALVRAEALMPLRGKLPSLANLKMHKARLYARRHSARQARRLFEEAAMSADLSQSTASRAQVWELAAASHLRDGDWDEALSLAREAYRLRKLSADRQISSSYLLLSRIHFEKGDFREALALADRAIASIRSAVPQFPLFSFYLARGLALQRTGDLDGARKDLEVAAASVRSLRLWLGASDLFRTSAGVEHAAVFHALADVYVGLFEETGRREYIRAGFEVSAEGRAYSLRDASGEAERIRDRLPLEYYSTLEAYRRAEWELLAKESADARRRTNSLRLQLAEWELRAGQSAPATGSGFTRAAAESPGHALLYFQLGDQRSLRWAVSDQGIDVTELAPAPEIESAIREFVDKTRRGGEASDGMRVSRLLLAGLPRRVLEAKTWRIAPDGSLFQLPFAALRLDVRKYLIEERAVRILAYPGSGITAAPRRARNSLAVFADPIYNPADERLADPSYIYRRFRANAGPAALPRLPGTAREAADCARLWPTGQARVFTGIEVTLSEIERTLATNPAVLHLATHLVPAPGDQRQSRLVLSMDGKGEPQLLNPETIATLPVRSQLVVMSGCRAGASTLVKGEGIAGMARSWLVAGAGSVVATHWPAPDDSGDLIQSFYKHWRSEPAPTEEEALRLAQLEMIRSASWRSSPRYWASYFVLGKS